MGGAQQCIHRIVYFLKICKSNIFTCNQWRPLTLCVLTLISFLSSFPCVGDIGVVMGYLGSGLGAVKLENIWFGFHLDDSQALRWVVKLLLSLPVKEGLPGILLLHTVPTHTAHFPHYRSCGMMMQGLRTGGCLSMSCVYVIELPAPGVCGSQRRAMLDRVLSLLSVESNIAKKILLWRKEGEKSIIEMYQVISGLCGVCNTWLLFKHL